jgi:hypothetical protein
MNVQNSTLSNILSVMVAETVSLGVLSLPAAVAGLGLVPYVSPNGIHDCELTV